MVDLINTNVPLHSEYLYSRGILEVSVYPDLILATGDDGTGDDGTGDDGTGDDVTVGSLAFCDNSKLIERKVASYICMCTCSS